MRRIGGIALTVTGEKACHGHLIITLPLLISLLAGTRLSSILSRNTGPVYTGAGIYFVMASAVGYWFLFGQTRRSNHGHDTCPICIPVDADESERRRFSSSEDLPVTRR